MYMFFKPVAGNQVDDLYKELGDEIKAIFGCKTISKFCENNNIELMAIALESDIMKPFDDSTIIDLLV